MIHPFIARVKCSGSRLLLLAVAGLVLAIVPIRMLCRRTPFKNYAFLVAFRWLRIVHSLLTALRGFN